MATTKAKAPVKSTGKAAPSKSAKKPAPVSKPASKVVTEEVTEVNTAQPPVKQIAPWEDEAPVAVSDDVYKEERTQELADLINSAKDVFQVTDARPEPKDTIQEQTAEVVNNAINAPRRRNTGSGSVSMSDVVASLRNKREEAVKRSNPLATAFKFR